MKRMIPSRFFIKTSLAFAALLVFPGTWQASGAAESAPAATSGTAAVKAPVAYGRFVPERMDDFAWENDLVAFRVYGPAILKTKGSEDSGIDCWPKRVKYPIIDKWYAGNLKGISYHKEHGEGYDFYHTGKSRGCGGTAIWANGQMILSGPYKEWKILSKDPARFEFELTYDYDMDGAKIREVKRIAIVPGRRLFRAESTFTRDGKPAALEIVVGVTTHDGKAKASFDPQKSWMSCWETIDNLGFGTGVVASAHRVIEMREIKKTKPDTGNAILLMKTDADGKVVCHAGYGWEKAGEITTREQWEAYLSQFAKSDSNR